MKDINEKYIAIVLCAGFGTRLKPLTNYVPKVVCPLAGKPIAFYNIEKFLNAGFHQVHCNTHYLSEIVEKELSAVSKKLGYEKNNIKFWHEETILETGGGIANIYKNICKINQKNINKDFIIVSGDIIADFSIEEMIGHWENKKENTDALMCTKKLLQERKDFTIVSNDSEHVLGFGQQDLIGKNEFSYTKKLFSNHQIIKGTVLENSPIEKKSSVDLFYRKILSEGKLIDNLNFDEHRYWFNIGTEEEYLEAISYFKKETNNHPANKMFYTPSNLKLECSIDKNKELYSLVRNLSIEI